MPRLMKLLDNKLLFKISEKTTPIMTLQQVIRAYNQQNIPLSDLEQLELFVIKGQLTDEFQLVDRSLEHIYINSLITKAYPDGELLLKDGIISIENLYLRENLKFLFKIGGQLLQIDNALQNDSFSSLDKSASAELFAFLYSDDYYKFEEITQQLREDELEQLYDLIKQKNDQFLKDLVDAQLLRLERPPLLLLLRHSMADDCYFDVLLEKILYHKDKCFEQREQFYNCFLNVTMRKASQKAIQLQFYATVFFRRLFYVAKAPDIQFRKLEFCAAGEHREGESLLEGWLIDQDNIDFGICSGK